MSVSVQQILADAKRLAGRLKEHDASADALLSQAQAMFRQVDTMKEVVHFSYSSAKYIQCDLSNSVSRRTHGTQHSSSSSTTP